MNEQTAQVIELPERTNGIGKHLLKVDQLVRNLAVVGGLVLVVIAVRNSTIPQAQSVFGAIQESAGMQWDESIGKLSFVNTLLPEEIQEVWSDNANAKEILMPLNGEVVHAWSANEPYLLIAGDLQTVYAADDGEVMAIAHGLDEELILRVRHEDNTESIYGNMSNVTVTEGDRVTAGEPLGTVRSAQPLAFELRENGRSVDPARRMPEAAQ